MGDIDIVTRYDSSYLRLERRKLPEGLRGVNMDSRVQIALLHLLSAGRSAKTTKCYEKMSPLLAKIYWNQPLIIYNPNSRHYTKWPLPLRCL
jgi:hypothetical protein